MRRFIYLTAASCGAMVISHSVISAAPAEQAANGLDVAYDVREFGPHLDDIEELSVDEGLTIAQARTSLAQQREIGPIVDQARKSLGPKFAGVRRSASTNAVEIYYAGTLSQNEREANAAHPEVTFVPVPRTEAELLSDGQKLFDALYKVAPEAFTFSADPLTGVFEVRVEPGAERAVEAATNSLGSLVGSQVALKIVDGVGGDDCSRTACAPPLRGGLRITSSVSTACSIGFNAQLNSNNAARVVLTSGHCANSTWKHNNTTIGTTGLRVDTGAVDAQRIPISNTTYWDPRNWIRRDSSWQYVISGKTSASSLFYDQYLCRVGGYSEDCGQINSTIASSGNNYPVIEVWDMCANDGDSGGSVFDPSNGHAVGLHVASSSGDICPGGFELSYFSSITAAEASLGVSILIK